MLVYMIAALASVRQLLQVCRQRLEALDLAQDQRRGLAVPYKVVRVKRFEKVQTVDGRNVG